MRYKPMMNNDSVGYFALEVRGGYPVPFLGAKIDAVVKSTSIETVIQQRFKNTEQETIEAIYNFPLPTDAVLLSLHLTLNDKRYSGVVKEAKQAAEEYEDAITDGDSAMMLQKISDNMYSLSVGNMQANDDVVIEIRYAQLLKWQGTQLRLMIPMTLAPRYGDSAKLFIQPEQQTESTLEADFKAGISITILDELKMAGFKSPTHQVSFRQTAESVVITAGDGNVPMDRDFILNITQEQKKNATAYYDKDIHDQWISWLSFTPEITAKNTLPRHLKIVVDCSGSMAGDSINQAKVAVREIVEIFSENDYFNIVNFGNSSESLFTSSQLATQNNKNTAFAWIAKTEADMGGTELGAALKRAYSSEASSSIQPDILLITDGQTNDVNAIVVAAGKSRHRHFTVGVGSAVSEDVVRGLAEKTDGACELVTPNEKMADSIVRHANRASVPRMTSANISFPNIEKALNATPLNQVYSGDTVHFFAQLNEQPQGNVSIKLEFDDVSWEENIVFQSYGEQSETEGLENMTLARMAAAQRMQATENKKAIIKLGVDYQLQSKETNYLVVVERENKDESAFGPELRKVNHMYAAGWGGTSSIVQEAGFDDYPERYQLTEERVFYQSAKLLTLDDFNTKEYLDIPEFLRRNIESQDVEISPNKFIKWLNRVNVIPTSLDNLEGYLDDSVLAALRECVENGVGEEELILEFLYRLSQMHVIDRILEKSVKRGITISYKKKITDVYSDNTKKPEELATLEAIYDELIEIVRLVMITNNVNKKWRVLPW